MLGLMGSENRVGLRGDMGTVWGLTSRIPFLQSPPWCPPPFPASPNIAHPACSHLFSVYLSLAEHISPRDVTPRSHPRTCWTRRGPLCVDPHQFASLPLRFASASVVARGRGRVVHKCCVRRGLFGLFRGAHMLKTVAMCSNLLVLILLWV